jgi:protein-tyrosine phosphatase
MSFTDNASTKRTEESLDSFSFVCGTERTPRRPTGLTPNWIPASVGVPLGSSPRPQSARPSPIVLTNSLLYNDVIEEEDSVASPDTPDTPFTPHTHNTVSRAVRAVKEIVHNRQFGLPSLCAPAPLIHGKLYLGDASIAMDTDTLDKYQITAVLNCAAGACLTDAEYYGEGFRYHEFYAEDDPSYDMSQHLEDALAFYTSCITEGRSVLVHCAAGINRSAFIAIYIYMVATGTTLLEAVKHCFAHRPIILCNEHFIHQLVLVAHRNEMGTL